MLKKIIYNPADPRTPKLEVLKVCTVRESNPDHSKTSDLLHKLMKSVASDPKGLAYFLTPNFDAQ